MSNHFEDHEHHDEQTAKESTRDKRYWLSLEQWSEDPEFQKLAEQEFASSPLREGLSAGDHEEGWARREFLKLMGASLAMATTSCIRRPVQKIVPYAKQPEEVTFQVPNFYTSTYFDGSESVALLVKTMDGRPLKIEGNHGHPVSKGGTTARVQASLLSLYDPERLQGPRRNLLNKNKTNRDTIHVKWEDMDKDAVKQLQKNAAGSTVILTGAINSPSMRQVIADFGQAFGARHVEWEPLAHEEIREGQKASFGEAVVPSYRFDKAKMIVSIDADFLGSWLTPTTFNKQFSAGRKDIKNMSKLVVFDSNYSLTGANADVRVRIKPSQQVTVVMGLAHEIVVKKGQSHFASDSKAKAGLSAFADAAKELAIEPALFSKIAEDLWANRGKSVVVAGGLPTLTAQAKDLQVAVNFLNSVLENDGATIDSKNAMPGLEASYQNLMTLKNDLENGKVKTLIIHRTNPLYALPEAFGFREAMNKAEMVFYTGDRIDETGLYADYMIPDNHPLENWGDAEIGKGVYSIHQPTIRPMYDTRSFAFTLMTWGYLAKKGPKLFQTAESFYDYLREYWKTQVLPKVGKGKAFEAFWDEVLQKGYAGEPANGGSSARSFKGDISNIKPVKASGYELVLYPSIAIGDGSMANISWLQELPDPITKICWDNYVSMSLATAEKLKVKEGNIMNLTVNGQKFDLPAHVQPGLHDDVLAIAVGYGRSAAGKVANDVGLNAYQMVTLKSGLPIYSGTPIEASNSGNKYMLACTQTHGGMEGRQILLEATLKQYLKDPTAGKKEKHVFSIWSGHQYNGHKWGMSVDLNSCTGCSACMVACMSENNIPVVGRKYVIQGRVMHWIRVDRYHIGNPTNAETAFQPVMCQQCDNAPCETVCPVAATTHSEEGLNDMVYNRCVGTRYCQNNCPYKVRRFNWFNYSKLIEKPLHLALNPDVTVRARGVMEKCTFCVHRIKAGKNVARLEKRELKDGEIKTACQTACPTDAITFGDLNDPNSQVAKIFQEERGYALLEEFHAKPNVRYLAKIRNNDLESRPQDDGKGGHA